MKTRLAYPAAFFLLMATSGPLLAQGAKPAEKAPQDKAAEHAPPKKRDKAAGYPESVKKELYATTDLRGKQQPKFEVEKWLSSEPQRTGKTVLIDFWATWCPPCVKLVPELIDFQKKFKDDLVVIGVSGEKEDTVRKFMKDKGVSYAMAIDTKETMSKALGVKGIPHVLVISSDGIVRWQGFPLSDDEQLTEETLKRIIDADKAEREKKKPADEKAKAPDAAKDKPAKK